MNKLPFTLNRRHLIKTLAAAGLVPALKVEQLLAANTAAPVRVLMVALQHGWGISGDSNRMMSGSESDFNFPDGLDPFNAIKDKCVVIDGLLTLGEWGNNHDLSYADILTAGVPHGIESSSFDAHMPLAVTPSLDYLLQQQSGQETFRFSAGYRSWGAQYHPLCFDTNSSVLPFYTRAFDAYNSLFKNLPDINVSAETGLNNAEAQLLQKVFEFVKAPTEARLDGLSKNEKEKLERYLLAVNYAQTKNTLTIGYSGSERIQTIPTQGQSRPDDVASYLDMIKVGFANNLTSSAVLGIGDINNIPDFHHVHAHADSDTWWDTRREFAQGIANFANALDKIIDVDGRTLLDNTVIMLTGEVGDGRHNIVNKGHILIGGGGGKINPGRWLQQTQVAASTNRREDVNGALQNQLRWSRQCSSRTNADLLREIGNIAGLKLDAFGLPSQNKGGILL